jgi:hypothetical protein
MSQANGVVLMHFATPALTSAKYVYVTNSIGFDVALPETFKSVLPTLFICQEVGFSRGRPGFCL